MLKRQLALLVAVVVAALFGVLSPGAAAAEPERTATAVAVAPAEDITAAASPTCSTAEGWGKIRYQACFRYNCDSNSCFRRSYVVLTNNATSPRTVDYFLYGSNDANGNQRNYDGDGTVTLASGEQKTILSPYTWDAPCAWWGSAWALVRYDSAGWSPEAHAKGFLPCV